MKLTPADVLSIVRHSGKIGCGPPRGAGIGGLQRGILAIAASPAAAAAAAADDVVRNEGSERMKI
eukprot:CAMPEP_0206534022 /NCGR_PEP_ID=MMETSP0325_2-20121206/5305_1 /ASSEMBLY_ACC=CAM_ASM_000347 /TAXON_ID=2866 /ORGANISM="Crypthecodinium cohnii, Strain Seligo" /LENGTH=64 /DNA_ID=CAMNT_0054030761 /DNA_START=346 /DNA_END=536 /DNA_ORIENTATION=-